ncbi:MAG: formylglycine-generating enzyme family protein [Gammaproteobacteria bacterium]|nr:MAG: formylglycine-generating enzyme family protein [Gammaproteobacteria bacterium]
MADGKVLVWLVCAWMLPPVVGSAYAIDGYEVFRDCEDHCPEMVVVPPGSFAMGHDGGEPERYEGPVREVNIDYAFAVGRFEVTQAQFEAFVAATGHSSDVGCFMWDGRVARRDEAASWRDPGYGRAPDPEWPVACVDWYDAQAYVAWLSEKTGFRYRLLSEAEWEYSAKAGSEEVFPWGDDPAQACLHANIFDESAARARPEAPIAAAPCDDGHELPSPVGSFQPNAFGLYDMVGNVWEWVKDCYAMPYPDSAPRDGSPQLELGCDRRSVRGGSWNTALDRQRPTFRGRDPAELNSQVFGFRVARDMD